MTLCGPAPRHCPRPGPGALAAGRFARVSRAEFAAAGVARISLGSALARLTHRAIRDAGLAMFGAGDFTPLGEGMAGSEVDRLLG